MNRFWVAPFRFGSVLVTLVCLQSSAGVAQAPQDEAWLKRSRTILKETSGQSAPEWLRQNSTQEALKQAELIAKQSGSDGSEIRQQQSHATGRVFIFGSFSIPDATLRALLVQASEANVVFVLRGIPAGQTIKTVLQRLKRMLPDRQQIPNVILDPTLFRRYQVQAVPAMVLERGDLEPVRVSGAVTVAWLRRMASSVQTGAEQLGRRAETYEIAETDFIVEMQRRMLAIDWDARRRAALDGYWRKPRPFVDLPDAREAKAYLVDPSVRVTEDLQDASGAVLIRAGEKLNPLEWTTLTKTVIVFRGTDERHLARAAAIAKDARAQGRGVILLTTRIDTARGWKHLNELEQALAGSVYVLPKSLVERFHLAHVPATVVAEGSRLMVREIPVEGAP